MDAQKWNMTWGTGKPDKATSPEYWDKIIFRASNEMAPATSPLHAYSLQEWVCTVACVSIISMGKDAELSAKLAWLQPGKWSVCRLSHRDDGGETLGCPGYGDFSTVLPFGSRLKVLASGNIRP
jgi:hypothetical protein